MVPVAGLMPALVPGMVDAGLVALREYGTKSFNEVIAPAIELADGSASTKCAPAPSRTACHFSISGPLPKTHFMPGGHVPLPGEIFRQPDLGPHPARPWPTPKERRSPPGKSRVAAIDAVRDYFYRGEIAHKIDAFSRANNGLLRYEDMAAFRLQPEEPVSTNFQRLSRSTSPASGARARP